MAKYLNSYERALLATGDRLAAMCTLVEKRLSDAMASFIQQDTGLASAVLSGDDEVDALDFAIEQEALELISLQQPDDRCLRFLTAAIRISRELERISDYSCDIAEATIQLNTRINAFEPLELLSQMAAAIHSMMLKSIKAHFTRDLASARQMDAEDDEVDRLFVRIFDLVLSHLKKNSCFVEEACMILLAARHLERIADHVVNISEMTVFIETGRRQSFRTNRAESASDCQGGYEKLH